MNGKKERCDGADESPGGSTPLRLLFVCTGNACRSQMAEGWVRHLGNDLVEARSAGIEAHGLDPRAVAAMAEAGVDISGQYSTRLTPGMLEWADIVVTVCAHADEHCPVLPAGKRRIHWLLEDPARAGGDEREVFRVSRDDIRRRAEALLEELGIAARARHDRT